MVGFTRKREETEVIKHRREEKERQKGSQVPPSIEACLLFSTGKPRVRA